MKGARRERIGSPEAMMALGARLADACPEVAVLFLEGDLGAGKTTLVRGFLRQLGVEGAIRSPTYTLLEPYEIGTRGFYHLDLYRITDPEEVEFMGIRDHVDESVLLVEWPRHGQGFLPAPDLWLEIEVADDLRYVTFEPMTRVGEILAMSTAAALD